METLTPQFISSHFLEFLIVLLLILSFFREEFGRWLKEKLGLKNGNGVEKKMDHLVSHYNHETTALLSSILGELKWVRKDQNNQSEKINTLINKVEEIIKYGVPERKQ